MRRRTVLAGAIPLGTVVSGCLDTFPGAGTTEFTVSDPPTAIREHGECSTGNVVGSLSFNGPLDAPGEESAVVKYRDLDSSSRSLVRFSLARGSAVTSEGAGLEPFRSLLDEFGDLSDRYRETHGERPRHHEVRTGDAFHRLDRLRVRDQVLDG